MHQDRNSGWAKSPSIVFRVSLVAAMLCGSWLRETTLGFTFFFSSLRLLDISYFYHVSHFNLAWTNDVRRATISYTFWLSRWVEGKERMKAKVKRGTAAGNLYAVCPCLVTCDSAVYKIWLGRSNDPASLQLLFVSKFIGQVICHGN